MKIANVSGRVALLSGEGGIDVATASGGRFGPTVRGILELVTPPGS